MQHVWIETPLIESFSPKIGDVRLLLKLENTQPSGSFKLRGIGNFCSKAKEREVAGLVSSSGGNAGLSCAYACFKLNIPLIIFLPLTTPDHVILQMTNFKATVKQIGNQWNEAHAAAINWLKTNPNSGFELVHPYDHEDIWAGHESIVDELAQQLPTPPDAIILSVGGGGLYNGIVQGLLKHNWTDTKVITMETEGANCLHQSRQAERLIHLDRITSIATTLGANEVSSRTWELLDCQETISHTCTDAQALHAVERFLFEHRMLVEPACGASLSAVYDGFLQDLVRSRRLLSDSTVVIIVCGGANVSLEMLDKWRSSIVQ